MAKLFIYNNSDDDWVGQGMAAGRFEEGEVTRLPAADADELHWGLRELIRQRRTFNRVLFQTHGNEGWIFFGEDALNASRLNSQFGSRGYEALFPGRTKIYFDGCNVAEGDAGWDFLTAAGNVFLKKGGGITMGFTSKGIGMAGGVPFFGGHTIHFWGDLRFIEFNPGGLETFRFTSGKNIFGNFEYWAKAKRIMDSF